MKSSLLAYAQQKLGEINSLRIIGTAAEKGAIVSFEMKNAHAHDFATVIDRAGHRGAGRYALCHAAAGTLRCHGHLPGVVRALQHP